VLVIKWCWIGLWAWAYGCSHFDIVMLDFNCDEWFWHMLTIVEPKVPCERLCPIVDLCECYHCGLIIDFAWVHLLINTCMLQMIKAIFLFSCYIIEPILFKLNSCANPLSLLWALKIKCVIPWTLSIVNILTTLLWAWESKWLLVMSMVHVWGNYCWYKGAWENL